MADSPQPLWVPDLRTAERSAMAAFARRVEREHGQHLADYLDLWRWSVEHLSDFWRMMWEFSGIRSGQPPAKVLTSTAMPGAVWFPAVRLNYTEQVFRDRAPDAVALVEATEDGRAGRITWAELERQTAAVAEALHDRGVRPGDRVAGYLPNSCAAVVAFLATASLGAIWSACGPDYAAAAAASRLAQLDPVVLICADGYHFAGSRHDRRSEAAALAKLLPSLRQVVHVPHLGLEPGGFAVPVTGWDELLAVSPAPLSCTPVPFDHPLWVLYSSGTTGAPKGLVHGHGGVVLEYHKVMQLHFDVTPSDRVFWYTTTNWMMWNFVVSALLAGSSILAYDGSPAHPHADQLWRLCAEHRVTFVGTSPGYLQASERHGDRPAHTHDLSALRLIGVTGSPVAPASFYWVHDQFGPVPLMPVSGGTDVVSALAIGAPTVPVWPGEISCPALGVALDAFDESGRPVRNQMGELVVTAPMPTMPLYLWNDPDGQKYRGAYFSTYPGVWRHGDWITITDRGSIIFHGRSDATLNRKGVRLGSADIYAIVDAIPGVRESLVLGIELPDAGYWMPLFVVLDDGCQLDDDMRAAITERLRREGSPRHVPDEIIAVPALPHTRTGKKIEVPLKRILIGANPGEVLSTAAVDDLASLEPFIALARWRNATP